VFIVSSVRIRPFDGGLDSVITNLPTTVGALSVETRDAGGAIVRQRVRRAGR
jgi:hypothetical protein